MRFGPLLFCGSSYPGSWVLAPPLLLLLFLLSLRGPQQLVKLPGLRLPVKEFSQATVQPRHTVLQLSTHLFRLKQGLHHLVTLQGSGWLRLDVLTVHAVLMNSAV